MARENRAATTSVTDNHIDTLISQGKQFRFFQALRLFDYAGTCGTKHNLRIRPSLNLSFPGNDIESITCTEKNKYVITANFFGLYGVSSPLPTFYTEDLIREKIDGRTSMRDFLDIIHAHYYPLLFKAWKKNRLWLSIEENEQKKNSALNYLLSFIGLQTDCQSDESDIDARSLIPFAGIFSHYPRSVAGLQTLISGLLQEANVEVIPCVLEHTTIPNDSLCLLGEQAHQLGENSILGNTIKQRSSRFEIIIGPLSRQQFLSYLPHTQRFKLLIQSIKHYCSNHYRFTIKFLIHRSQRQPLEVGDAWSNLGLNTWLDTSHSAAMNTQTPRYDTIVMGSDQS